MGASTPPEKVLCPLVPLHGAATSCNADVFAYSASQVKKALEVTHRLGGENYVFWGGREGYQNLYNTDMKRELDHLAKFFHMAVDYAKEIGFTGQFLIEPKPKEPTKHQYDSDAAACMNFLRSHGLENHFKLDGPRSNARNHSRTQPVFALILHRGELRDHRNELLQAQPSTRAHMLVS